MKKRLFIFLASIFLLSASLWAQNEKFKALFMYNFTKYIEWPASMRQGDFVIGVMGNAAMTKELENIAAKMKVGTQSIVIKTIGSVSEINSCNIIFIAASKSSNLQSVIEKANNSYMAVITEKSGCAQQGAGINYVMDGDKIRFEVNKSALEKSGLAVSSQLISLGIAVGN